MTDEPERPSGKVAVIPVALIAPTVRLSFVISFDPQNNKLQSSHDPSRQAYYRQYSIEQAGVHTHRMQRKLSPLGDMKTLKENDFLHARYPSLAIGATTAYGRVQDVRLPEGDYRVTRAPYELESGTFVIVTDVVEGINGKSFTVRFFDTPTPPLERLELVEDENDI